MSDKLRISSALLKIAAKGTVALQFAEHPHGAAQCAVLSSVVPSCIFGAKLDMLWVADWLESIPVLARHDAWLETWEARPLAEIPVS